MVYIITTLAFALTSIVTYAMYSGQKKKHSELSIKYDSVMKYAQSLEKPVVASTLKPTKAEATKTTVKKGRKKMSA